MAQKNPVFGFEIKSVIPSTSFSNASREFLHNERYRYSYNPQLSFGFGANVRRSIYRKISLEAGIHMTRRSYSVEVDSADKTHLSTDFTVISFEIPLKALIYIQLSERSFLDNAFGLSLDFLPNDVLKVTPDSLKQVFLRKYFILPALTAATGYELRTKKSGYFYVGASYHRMLTVLGYSRTYYPQFRSSDNLITPVAGHYFSIDLKYFLPVNKGVNPEDQNYY